MALFELKNATIRYNDHTVLQDISLTIEQGQKVAFVGQSGAGKSTLLSLFFEQRTDDTALVPQELGLVNSLSVFHNIFMGRLHHHSTWYNALNLIKPLKREIELIEPIITRLGLQEKIYAPVQELSGGQQQRTAVGRALHKGGKVFLGDEPVSAVDEHQSRVVLESIMERHETVVLSMHDVNLAIKYADRIIGIKEGRIRLDCPTNGMKASDLDHLYHN